jgi:thiamine-phosphate pyrophosphorylase
MVLRYAITSRALYSGGEHEKQATLLRQASRWAVDGLDLIQLREKDLPSAAIAALARQMLKAISVVPGSTKLLINSRPDIAVATGAHGVHLTADPDELTPAQVRSLYASATLPAPIVTVSCHTLDDVRRARKDHADAILFAPVFEKRLYDQQSIAGQGLDRLQEASTVASPIPVFALGGVTLDSVKACVAAGAAGVAGIRLFHNS